jgi:excisionase family DNA binding protein
MAATAWLRAGEVARLLNVHRSTVYRLVSRGVLPPPVRLSGSYGQSGGIVRWRESEIDQVGQRLVEERDAAFANGATSAKVEQRRVAARRSRQRARAET